jgi:hypothetical protein
MKRMAQGRGKSFRDSDFANSPNTIAHLGCFRTDI